MTLMTHESVFLVGDNSIAFTEDISYEPPYFANVGGAFLYLKTYGFVFHMLHGYVYSVRLFVLHAHVLEHFYRIMIGVIV